MNVHYTGGQGELTDAQFTKLEKRFVKLGKMIDGKGSKEAHVILTPEKRQKKAEITVNFRDHSLVAIAKGPAFLPALTEALDKLDKQVIKLREKKMAKVRNGVKPASVPVKSAADVPVDEAPRPPRILPAKVSKKPMSVDEAVLVCIRKAVPYVAFRDADTEGISVVIRRGDGNFDFFQA